MSFLVFNKQASLRFDMKELLDDIKGYAYIEGDTMQGDDAHAKHQVYDICEPGNIELVTRNLNSTFAKCVELCFPYTKKEVGCHTSRDNEYEEGDDFVMRLNLPARFSDTTVTLLETQIHELLVSKVMEEWMGITKKESVPYWSAKVMNAEQQIKSALHGRTGRIRRKLTPY